MVLLALTPFLHGHLGQTQVSGFHVDGLRIGGHSVGATPDAAQALAPASQASQEESAALGVSVSIRQAGDDAGFVLDLACLLLCWVFFYSCALTRPLPLWRVTPAQAPRLYESGWPPPALAPPHFS